MSSANCAVTAHRLAGPACRRDNYKTRRRPNHALGMIRVIRTRVCGGEWGAKSRGRGAQPAVCGCQAETGRLPSYPFFRFGRTTPGELTCAGKADAKVKTWRIGGG